MISKPRESKSMIILAFIVCALMVVAIIAAAVVILSQKAPQNPAENLAPTARFTCPESGHVGDDLSFDASSSSDPDGTIASYNWDFGDGNRQNVTTAVILHSFSNAGTFNVSLIVTDNGSKSSTRAIDAIEISAISANGLVAWLQPASVSIAKGESVTIYAFASFQDSALNPPINVSGSVALSMTCDWAPPSNSLGTLTRVVSGGTTYFRLASTTSGSSILNWTFGYTDPYTLIAYVAYEDVPVTVTSPILSYVQIDPAESVLVTGSRQIFTAQAYLTDGTQTTATHSWSLSNASLGNLNSSVGVSVTFTAGGINATGNLTCTATLGLRQACAVATLTILTQQPSQSIDVKVYDLFNVPLGDWWKYRHMLSAETVMSYTYPVAYEWKGSPIGNDWLYSDFRMNITAKNVSKCNTTSNLLYLPAFSPTVRGGHVHINWTANYISWDEANKSYPNAVTTYYDTWFFRLNGTVTMDRTAAKMILNMTDPEFDNFNAWKTTKFEAFTGAWDNWITKQMNVYWDIRFAYESTGYYFSSNYDIVKSGETITLIIKDHCSWGMDALLPRWWRATFSDYEGFPEDVHFAADIGPLWSDFRLDTCEQYGLAAIVNPRTGNPAWVFEQIHADCVPGSDTNYGFTYVSEFNPYATPPYWTWEVGNYAYGTVGGYSQTPWAINLSANDKWSIEWPAGNNVKGYYYNGTGNFDKTITGRVVLGWIDPVPGEVPSNLDLNLTARKLTITGPFDGLNWSKDTNADREVRENWSTVGALPRGVPYMVFDVVNASDQPPVAAISVEPIVTINIAVQLISAGYDPDGLIVNWSWEFGDGNISWDPNPVYVWHASGSFIVNLIVKDDNGLTARDSVTVQVS